MKKALVERNIIAVLFVMVLVVFSLAQRDTDRINHMLTQRNKTEELIIKKIASSTPLATIKPAQ